MGLTGISLGQLTLVFLIAVLLFGSSRLKQLGEDIGSAIRGFQKGLKGESSSETTTTTSLPSADDKQDKDDL